MHRSVVSYRRFPELYLANLKLYLLEIGLLLACLEEPSLILLTRGAHVFWSLKASESVDAGGGVTQIRKV